MGSRSVTICAKCYGYICAENEKCTCSDRRIAELETEYIVLRENRDHFVNLWTDLKKQLAEAEAVCKSNRQVLDANQIYGYAELKNKSTSHLDKAIEQKQMQILKILEVMAPYGGWKAIMASEGYKQEDWYEWLVKRIKEVNNE